MKYAIVSDLHANETALRAVLSDAAACGAERVICLGDIVGYGPLPAETLRLIRKHAAIILAGNHDDAVSGRGDASAFIQLAGDAAARHREALSSDDLKFLSSLPYTASFSGALAAHGDFTTPGDFNYISEISDAKANFIATDEQLMFVGHTHVPGFFLTGQSGSVYWMDPQDFILEEGKRYIVNPGSVGYPRECNGECRSTYVIYDDVERSVSYRFLPFSVASVLQRGRNPRRLKKRTIAMFFIAVAVIASAVTYALVSSTATTDERSEPAQTTNVVAIAAESVITSKSLTLPYSAKYVRANLALAKGSEPVQLSVTFHTPAGENVNGDSRLVKGSSRQRITIPEGVISVDFRLLKTGPDSKPQIIRFEPAWE